MNIQQQIVAANIQRIKQLADGHPVFRVDFAAGAVVVKSENANKGQKLKDPIEIMNAIDSHAPSRVMTKPELMGIKSWAATHGGDLQEKQPGFLVGELAKALMPPLPGGVIRQSSVFIIMQMKAGLMDLKDAGVKALGKDDEFNLLTDDDGNPVVKDKSGVRQLAAILNGPGVLEKLGEIVAVDAFNGNQDRVNFDGTGMKWDDTTRLACIQNPGNIFVGDAGGRRTVLGLDVFDPFNNFGDFSSFDERVGRYTGRIFKSDAAARRAKLAQDLASDIEIVLGPRNRKFSFLKQTRLPKDAAARIARGFGSGGDKILAYLKLKYAAGGIPLAMKQRITACGWMSHTNFPRI